jgi:hypothetical protein
MMRPRSLCNPVLSGRQPAPVEPAGLRVSANASVDQSGR